MASLLHRGFPGSCCWFMRHSPAPIDLLTVCSEDLEPRDEKTLSLEKGAEALAVSSCQGNLPQGLYASPGATCKPSAGTSQP